MTKQDETASLIEANYDRFIQEVVQTGQVWGIESTKYGWANCASEAFETTDVLLFWSSQAAAQEHCCEEWKDYQPKCLPLEDFIIDWLPGMHEDDALVGANFTADLEGLEVEPADVAKELELAGAIQE